MRAIGAAPCSAPFAGTGEEVEIKYAQMRAIGIFTFESRRFGMRSGNVFNLGERDAVEPVSDIEHAVAYFFELQVGTHSIFVEVEFTLYYLFIIVTPVPALQRLVETYSDRKSVV